MTAAASASRPAARLVELRTSTSTPAGRSSPATVTVDGEEAAADAPLFFLDGSTLEPLRRARQTAVLEGTTVKLKKEAADLLNETFGITTSRRAS